MSLSPKRIDDRHFGRDGWGDADYSETIPVADPLVMALAAMVREAVANRRQRRARLRVVRDRR